VATLAGGYQTLNETVRGQLRRWFEGQGAVLTASRVQAMRRSSVSQVEGRVDVAATALANYESTITTAASASSSSTVGAMVNSGDTLASGVSAMVAPAPWRSANREGPGVYALSPVAAMGSINRDGGADVYV
jgi:hypothetical protein